MRNISERLTWLRREERLSQKDFAQRLGLSQSYISSLESGERELSANLLRQLSSQMGISADWLLKGEGSPYREAPPTVEMPLQHASQAFLGPAAPDTATPEAYLSGQQERLQVVTVNADNQPQIVLVPVKAHAGYALGRTEPTFMQELPVLALPDARFRHGTFRAFEVAGDSMEPTLYGMDMVVCRALQDWRWIRTLEMYVVVLSEDVLVKRLRMHDSGRPTLDLVSDNPFYPPVRVPLAEVKEIWHVTARITTHLPAPPRMAQA